MQWIFQLIVRYKSVFSFLLCVVTSLWMISSPPRRQARIGRALTATVFFPVQYTVSQVNKVGNIFAENRRLNRENTRLRTESAILREYRLENERLRSLLSFKERFSYELVPVFVVAREPSHLSRSIVVNAGATEGVERFMPLVSTRGVVGKIVQVLPRLSLVQLLKDPSSRISIMTRRSREIGILVCEGGRIFTISYRTYADVVPGDRIITSGLGGHFPKGLPVGEISKIEEHPDPLYKKASVTSSVNFNHLEEVFIIKLSPQWSAFRNELDSIPFSQ